MTNGWITILIAICTIGIAAIPPTGDLFKSAPKRKPTWRYWAILLLTMGSFFLGLEKDHNAASDKEKDQKLAKLEQDKRDSIAKDRTDESNKGIVNAFADGLGKYQLKYDSSTKAIIKIIRDSAKRVISAPEEEPSLMINTNPVTLDSSNGNVRFFSINLKSFKGEVDNIHVRVIPVKGYGDKFTKFPDNPDVAITNTTLSEGMRTMLPVSLYASKTATIYFHVFGSYTNKKKSLRFTLDEICFFDLDKMESGFLTAGPDKKIRKFIRDGTK